MPQDFLDELAAVQAQVAAATETEHSSLGEFIRYEVSAKSDSPLAGIVLAAGLPADDNPDRRAGRIHLACAMVLLDVALSLHKLLLLQNPNTDTLDKSLVGGTVLAGDYCFSQAAVAAARTGNPAVVTIFSDLLKDLSEAHLRHLFQAGPGGLNELPALFRSGGLAGAVLAGLDETQQQAIAAFAAGLAEFYSGEENSRAELAGSLTAGLLTHQQPRWHYLLEIAPANGN